MSEKKVLLIEDEAGLRRSLTATLLQHNFDIEPCESGIKALSKLESYTKKNLNIDYILTDIRLPDIDGLKLLKVIKSKYPNIPVIVMTAFGDSNTKQEVELEHGDGYLDKPFATEDLTTILAKLDQTNLNPEPKKEASTHTASAYALIQIASPDNFIKVYEQIHFLSNIVYCDATKGEYDLILLVQGKDIQDIQKFIEKEVLNVEGVSQVDLISVKEPILEESLQQAINIADQALENINFKGEKNITRNPRSLSSYVLLDIEKEKIDQIYPALYFNDNIVYCDITHGTYSLILLIQGQSFEEIDKVINNRIKQIDGITLIKKCPIIKLFEM